MSVPPRHTKGDPKQATLWVYCCSFTPSHFVGTVWGTKGSDFYRFTADSIFVSSSCGNLPNKEVKSVFTSDDTVETPRVSAP